jgi:hypothetical protein
VGRIDKRLGIVKPVEQTVTTDTQLRHYRLDV